MNLHIYSKIFPSFIFTSQPNIVVESGVHSSLHSNCHHQTIFGKFYLKIYYQPPYLIEFWHYKEANADLIKRAINNFIWVKAFSNTNSKETFSLFNKTILNILNNYILHETIICGDKDSPWFTSRIKLLIENKDNIRKNYERFKSNGQLHCKLNRVNWTYSKNNSTLNKKIKTKLLLKNGEQTD